jgi:hypothetical protein
VIKRDGGGGGRDGDCGGGGGRRWRMVERNGGGGRELVDHGVEGHVLQIRGIAQPRLTRERRVVQVRKIGVVVI